MRNFFVSTIVLSCAICFFSCAPPSGQKGLETGKPGEKDAIAARIGDMEIKESEIESRLKGEIIKKRQEIYQLKKEALDDLIAERLTEQEAASRGVTKSDLLREEVDGRIKEVTDEDVENFYNQNKARMRKPLEEIREAIRDHLRKRQRDAREKEFIEELKTKTDVVLLLEPIRYDVSDDDDPFVGPRDAPIQIIEFSEFECPYCRRGARTVLQAKEHYGELVRVVFRDFPLSFHKNSEAAAEAAQCANDQGKFWAFHDKLFENQRKLSREDLIGYAEDLELEKITFEECLNSRKYSKEIDKDREDGADAGVTGTPCFFINGIMLKGAQPFEAFEELINNELEKKGIPPPKS